MADRLRLCRLVVPARPTNFAGTSVLLDVIGCAFLLLELITAVAEALW